MDRRINRSCTDHYCLKVAAMYANELEIRSSNVTDDTVFYVAVELSSVLLNNNNDE